MLCPACGRENPEGFKFCGFCTAALVAPEPVREVRKTVTIVFADVTGSTAIGERLDPESLRRVMGRYFDEMQRVIERHGGTVEKFIGDAVMAVFGIPTLHEDDALRAVRAVAEMREALTLLNRDLERDHGVGIVIRTGVNTGEVVAGDPTAGQRLVTGDTVNTAARLEQAAPPGDILIGGPTWRLVRDAVKVEPVDPLSLKGKAEAVPAYRLLSVIEGAAGTARRLDSPMVGRERELRLLADGFQRMASERGCHLFTLLGVAGIGKSRLVSEFLQGVGTSPLMLQGRCLPYGEGITFWPVAEVVREAAAVVESDPVDEIRAKLAAVMEGDRDGPIVVERVAEVLGISAQGAGSGEELFWGIRKFFETLARDRPVVVLLDDVHWAEPMLLDLIEHVADWSRDAPILLVPVARPELLDRRPGWGGGKFNATSLLLEPLSDEECDQLITNLLGGGGLGPEVRRRILDAAEGNPLFVEQTLAMLIDDGLLSPEDGRWVPAGDLSRVAVPPTIQALLAARLDQLVLSERAIMERASVVGKVFYRGAVRELLPEAERTEVTRNLMTLVRKELIRPDPSSLVGQDAFRFRNLLIRDAAYGGLPKETRAELHERYSGWLEETLGERSGEYAEILGYHLEQACRYRAELGPVDKRGVELARRAARWLGAAGRAAFTRRDVPAANNLLSRALSLLPQRDPLGAELQLELADVKWSDGDVDGWRAAVGESLATGRLLEDERLIVAAELVREDWDAALNPAGWAERAAPVIDRATRVLERYGDERGVSRALRLAAQISTFAGRMAEGDSALERALEHARRSGDAFETATLLVERAVIATIGPASVDEAMSRWDDARDLSASYLGLQARMNRYVALLLAMRGSFGEAREMLGRAQEILDELGWKTWNQAENWEFEGNVAMLAGEPDAAALAYGRTFDWLLEVGDKGWGATVAAEAARARCLAGDLGEAAQLARWSEENGAPEDAMTQLMWSAVSARIRSFRGEFDLLDSLAERSLAAAAGTDLLSMHANARMDLAEAYLRAGRRGEAESHTAAARTLYELKGNLAGAGHARALQDLIGG